MAGRIAALYIPSELATMLLVSGLLLTAWIIGWLVFEITSPWVHVLLVAAIVFLAVHVMRTVWPKSAAGR